MCTTTPKIARHYYRCRACCHVVAVEGTLVSAPAANGATEITTRCVCDGRLELLGRVARNKRGLVLDSERCACDGRCTSAPGPMCDCSCGGVNHGTGRVVAVEVDAGGIPRLAVGAAAEVDACKARAAEYAAAMEPHRSALRTMRQDRVISGRRPTLAEDQLAAALGSISRLRTHKGRLTAIVKLSRS